MCGLLIAVASAVVEHGLQGTRAPVGVASRHQDAGTIVVAHGISGSVASSRIRDGTHVSCTGRQIPYYSATRESPVILFFGSISVKGVVMI